MLDYFQINPKYLHSNSTSHKWAFSAVAELIGKLIKSGVLTFCVEAQGESQLKLIGFHFGLI